MMMTIEKVVDIQILVLLEYFPNMWRCYDYWFLVTLFWESIALFLKQFIALLMCDFKFLVQCNC